MTMALIDEIKAELAKGQPAAQPQADMSQTIADAVTAGVKAAMSAQEPAAAPPAPAPAPPAPAMPNTFAALVGQQITSGSTPPANQVGPPAPNHSSEGTPLIKLSAEDRAHLLATKGQSWYAAQFRRDMRNTTILLDR